MSFGEQIEDVALGGMNALPAVGTGIGIGILISIIPVTLMAIGLKLTNAIFYRVVE